MERRASPCPSESTMEGRDVSREQGTEKEGRKQHLVMQAVNEEVEGDLPDRPTVRLPVEKEPMQQVLRQSPRQHAHGEEDGGQEHTRQAVCTRRLDSTGGRPHRTRQNEVRFTMKAYPRRRQRRCSRRGRRRRRMDTRRRARSTTWCACNSQANPTRRDASRD